MYPAIYNFFFSKKFFFIKFVFHIYFFLFKKSKDFFINKGIIAIKTKDIIMYLFNTSFIVLIFDSCVPALINNEVPKSIPN